MRNPIPLQITLSVEAVKKLVEQIPPSDSEMKGISARPTLKPWVEIIDRIMKEDAPLPRRVRTSVMQIFKKLREEHGYMGCYTVVREYVHNARNPPKQKPEPVTRSKKHVRDEISAASETHPEPVSVPVEEARIPPLSALSVPDELQETASQHLPRPFSVNLAILNECARRRIKRTRGFVDTGSRLLFTKVG